jgi:murein DD-endopeptidase MepM/ murein hydrolase activator NlpD
MFIPEGETNAQSHHISKRTFLLIIVAILFIVVSGLGSMAYYIPKISKYHVIKDQHAVFTSERIKVLNLTRDLERIKQMDDLVRSSLGTTLDLIPRSYVSDSLRNVNEEGIRKVSYIENIPSVAPINGFISQKTNMPGLFVKSSHNGIDIVAQEGEPILASASGVVVFSGWTYEFGNMVILYHGDDYFTHYGHNKNNLVEKLDIVDRGDVIGLVGSTGISTGPHLHFEVWRQFVPMDPFAFFPEYNNSNLTLTND